MEWYIVKNLKYSIDGSNHPIFKLAEDSHKPVKNSEWRKEHWQSNKVKGKCKMKKKIKSIAWRV